MTEDEIRAALRTRAKVCAGHGRDYEEGRICAIGGSEIVALPDRHPLDKPGWVFVTWDSRVSTWARFDEIEPWSEDRRRTEMRAIAVEKGRLS